MVIDMADISCMLNQEAKSETKDDTEVLSIGRGQTNLTLNLVKPVIYHGGMGQLPEPMSMIHLSVDNPQDVIAAIEASRAGIAA
jgi:hypothetical protein